MSTAMLDMGILKKIKKRVYEKFASLVQLHMQYCDD